jgi:hypothetical protein
MKKGIFVVLILALVMAFAMPIAAGPSDTYALYPVSADPCLNSNVAKKSAAISVSTSTVTSLIAAVTGKRVYVCNVAGAVQTATTFKLWSGITDATGACNTSKTALTGAMNMAANSAAYLAYGGTVAVSSGSSTAVCMELGGANNFNGIITYVQQ